MTISFFSIQTIQQGVVAKVSFQQGDVKLKLLSVVSIVLTDSLIDFGSCKINETKNNSLYISSENNSFGDNVLCKNSTLPDFFIIENDGTIDVNVSTKLSKLPSQEFNDSSSWIAFKAENATSRPGCITGLQSDYINITQSNVSQRVCSRLSFLDDADQINFFVELYVTNNSKGNFNSSIQFTGVPV